MRQKPGAVRDAIVSTLTQRGADGASVSEILGSVREQLGSELPASSVRSYLRLNTPKLFERVSLGKYKLRGQK